MSIEITGKTTRNGLKKWYTLEWGKGPGERIATGIFTYTKPKDKIERDYNKEAHSLLATKKAQLLIEQQSIGTPYIPSHKFKDNFLVYYSEFVENNKRPGNRHLQGSYVQLKKFVKKGRLQPLEITENFSQRFRNYLLDHFTGKTPSDYFGAYKRVIKSAFKDGYFRVNPAEDIKSKKNPSKKLREFLEANEYIQLINTNIINKQLRSAFILSLYTGLRWCDIEAMEWKDLKENVLVTRLIQNKTGNPVEITLHPVAEKILKLQRQKMTEQLNYKTKLSGRVFRLPTHDGANKSLVKWVRRAKIDKYITWHSARLSFSILLQDKNVDLATVAALMGHTTTRYVSETYKRHRPKNQMEAITKLPDIELEKLSILEKPMDLNG